MQISSSSLLGQNNCLSDTTYTYLSSYIIMSLDIDVIRTNLQSYAKVGINIMPFEN
jgi:hypothetical protein